MASRMSCRSRYLCALPDGHLGDCDPVGHTTNGFQPEPVGGPTELIKHDKCANTLCPNQPHEGRFGTLVLRSRAGAFRDMALIMCVPCGEALRKELR